MWLAGIDLSGKDSNPSPICLYSTKDRGFVMKIAYSDNNIVSILDIFKPKIISIDAPLSLPMEGAFRECEKELIRRGYRPLNLNIPSMRLLYERARKLLPKITKYGKVIEVFATASLSELKITREYAERVFNRKLNKDEIDAFACCLTSYHYLEGKYVELGDKKEGTIILPQLM